MKIFKWGIKFIIRNFFLNSFISSLVRQPAEIVLYVALVHDHSQKKPETLHGILTIKTQIVFYACLKYI